MRLAWLPNALTISRCVFAALILYGAWKAGLAVEALAVAEDEDFDRLAALEQLWRQFILLAFIAGAFTDYSDGWLARRLKAESRFGVWLDPIADKLLVAAALLSLVWLIGGWLIIIPAAAIIWRDAFMTAFRFTPRGKSVVHVSRLAKWKTALEMIAIAALMAPGALAPRTLSSDAPRGGVSIFDLIAVGFVLCLWVAAALSVYSAWNYLRAAYFKGGNE